MTADLLRRAAAKIRETAKAADAGPWYPADGNALHWHGPDPDLFIDSAATLIAYGPIKETNAEHIALWSPDVAERAADLLDVFADLAEREGYPSEPESPALRLARRILGEGDPSSPEPSHASYPEGTCMAAGCPVVRPWGEGRVCDFHRCATLRADGSRCGSMRAHGQDLCGTHAKLTAGQMILATPGGGRIEAWAASSEGVA
jgi:hypothetical protein